MPNLASIMPRICRGPPRRWKSYMPFVLISTCVALFVSLVAHYRFSSDGNFRQSITTMEARLTFLETLYLVRDEEFFNLQENTEVTGNNSKNFGLFRNNKIHAVLKPEVVAMLKTLTGTQAALGVRTRSSAVVRSSYVLKLMPHLMDDAEALRPSYHMQAGRKYVDFVIGIPTVKRDKESYIMVTMKHLVDGLNESDMSNTLIIVFVGETDLLYVLEVASKIETMFPLQVKNGLIEVMSPSPSYYPDLDKLPRTLGDSQKRVKWRAKQNLDSIYLMSYAQSKGTYYLMLEDDVISTSNYMQEIKQFTAAMSVSVPNWYIIEFCRVGGIGKLFKSAHLIDFIIYVQLFYANMPIDWLIESYLADRVCTIDKASDPKFSMQPTFYPHSNPPLQYIKTSLKEDPDHTLKAAYEGKSYFWGSKPKEGDTIEFYFAQPTVVVSYTFRSGNVKHPSDKFYDTVVEVYRANTRNYTILEYFDEFGLADGKVKESLGPLLSIRLRINRDSFYWALLSEIDIRTEKKMTIPDPIEKHPVKRMSQMDLPRRKAAYKKRIA